MDKIIPISYLVIVIAVLVGFIILSNYPWFSEIWFAGLAIVFGGATVGIFIGYVKITDK